MMVFDVMNHSFSTYDFKGTDFQCYLFTIFLIITKCFYKISLMCQDMDLELSIHKETAHLDDSFLKEIIQISIFFIFCEFLYLKMEKCLFQEYQA